MTYKSTIVVVGGGAGGLGLVRRLGARFGHGQADVILVDKNLTHIWKPLLHEVAAGTLDANMDEVGYGGHGVRWGYRFIKGALETIDRSSKEITIAAQLDEDGNEIIGQHRLRYDYLVLAFGGVSNHYNIEGVEKNALFLETRNQADVFRLKLLNACMRVRHAIDRDHQKHQVQIAIVGGGATGVELAAELYNAASALKQYGLDNFESGWLKVTLLEAGPRILPMLTEKLATAARKDLEALGVTVLTDKQVSCVEKDRILVRSGDIIPADMTVWAAGVKACESVKLMADFDLDRLNRIIVRKTLQTSIDDHIYALGDCASFIPEGADRPLHPRAQAAQQMAKIIFKNLAHEIEGKPLVSFKYNDRGSLVNLGRRSTVGSLMGNLIGGNMPIQGRLARFAYLSLYRMHLIAIHGWIKALALMAIGRVNQIIRPKLKLH